MRLDDFDYELPEGRIAARPTDVRDAARLLVHDVPTDATEHRRVAELDELLRSGDLLVVNDTRVLPARVAARRATGGSIELFFLAPDAGGRWRAMATPSRRLKVGEELEVERDPARFRLLARDDREWLIELVDDAGREIPDVLRAIGRVPLPPYIERDDDDADRSRYQTVYAANDGAVAAPTAGLHFTPELFARLEAAGVRRASVTLHVGAGTFLPVQSEDPREHRMHAERYVLPRETAEAIAETRAAGGRVVAVGTTAVRTLESCAGEDGTVEPGAGETRLFLLPGGRFRAVDVMLTNFHLPKSTLLMLVSAFAGRERVLRLYAEAIEAGYRFYSYGDAMLLSR